MGKKKLRSKSKVNGENGDTEEDQLDTQPQVTDDGEAEFGETAAALPQHVALPEAESTSAELDESEILRNQSFKRPKTDEDSSMVQRQPPAVKVAMGRQRNFSPIEPIQPRPGSSLSLKRPLAEHAGTSNQHRRFSRESLSPIQVGQRNVSAHSDVELQAELDRLRGEVARLESEASKLVAERQFGHAVAVRQHIDGLRIRVQHISRLITQREIEGSLAGELDDSDGEDQANVAQPRGNFSPARANIMDWINANPLSTQVHNIYCYHISCKLIPQLSHLKDRQADNYDNASSSAHIVRSRRNGRDTPDSIASSNKDPRLMLTQGRMNSARSPRSNLFSSAIPVNASAAHVVGNSSNSAHTSMANVGLNNQNIAIQSNMDQPPVNIAMQPQIQPQMNQEGGGTLAQDDNRPPSPMNVDDDNLNGEHVNDAVENDADIDDGRNSETEVMINFQLFGFIISKICVRFFQEENIYVPSDLEIAQINAAGQNFLAFMRRARNGGQRVSLLARARQMGLSSSRHRGALNCENLFPLRALILRPWNYPAEFFENDVMMDLERTLRNYLLQLDMENPRDEYQRAVFLIRHEGTIIVICHDVTTMEEIMDLNNCSGDDRNFRSRLEPATFILQLFSHEFYENSISVRTEKYLKLSCSYKMFALKILTSNRLALTSGIVPYIDELLPGSDVDRWTRMDTREADRNQIVLEYNVPSREVELIRQSFGNGPRVLQLDGHSYSFRIGSERFNFIRNSAQRVRFTLYADEEVIRGWINDLGLRYDVASDVINAAEKSLRKKK